MLTTASPFRIASGITPGGAINRSHPLNKGRLAWWLALPGRAGPRWYDLVGSKHGTLASGAVPSAASTRPSGYGSILSMGGAYVAVGAYAALKPTSGMSMSCWATPLGTQQNYASICEQTYDATHTNPYHSYKLGLNQGGDGRWSAEITNGGTRASIAPPFSYVLGIPTHTCMIYDGSNFRFFVNGVFLEGQTGITSSISYGAGSYFRIGGNADGGEYFAGNIDSVAIWSRGLSDSEVWSDFDLGRRGYPGVLNRVSLARLLDPGAAPPPVVSPLVADFSRPHTRRTPTLMVPVS